jgi:hypothetical protein
LIELIKKGFEVYTGEPAGEAVNPSRAQRAYSLQQQATEGRIPLCPNIMRQQIPLCPLNQKNTSQGVFFD